METRKSKKPMQRIGFLSSEIIERLDRPDVFSPRPFRAVSRIVGDSLSLPETIEIRSFDIRHVKEHVLVRPGLDKSETLVRQPLDSTLCHTISFLKKQPCDVARHYPAGPLHRVPEMYTRNAEQVNRL